MATSDIFNETYRGLAMRYFRQLVLILVMALASTPLRAGEATIAVATNFAETQEALVGLFAQSSGAKITTVTGSTGRLYGQIVNGAPFDAFLSADAARPALLIENGHAVGASLFTYAQGKLALWSADPNRVGTDGAKTLAGGQFRHLAIANPALAPYGLAAQQTLAALGLDKAVEKKLVMGEDIGQAFAMIASANAELGFVALAAVHSPRNEIGGSYWIVPETLHDPIRQDAVLLKRGENNATAKDYLAFLKSDGARALMAERGFGSSSP